MTYDDIMTAVASSCKLDKKTVSKIYFAYWKAVRDHIKALPLKEDLNEMQFNKLKPNVNIPSLGKLYVTYDYYKRVKKHYSLIQTNK